jgi:uracil-DNA glycosylase family 4
MTKTQEEIDAGPDWISSPIQHESYQLLPGTGELPSRVMIVGLNARDGDFTARRLMSSPQDWKYLYQIARSAGFSIDTTYRTCLMKGLPVKKKPSAQELRMCQKCFREELRRSQCELVICLGADVFKLLTNKAKISEQRMELLENPEYPGIQFIGTYDPGAIRHDPRLEETIISDWQRLAKIQRGESRDLVRPPFHTFNDGFEFAHWVQRFMESKSPRMVTVDCEWDGRTWMDPEGWLRLVQIGTGPETACVLNLYNAGKVPAVAADPERYKTAIAWLKYLLEDPNTRICGHNTIADGEWLLAKYDINIAPNTRWDTMIAEHVLDSAAQFNLTALTEKYWPEIGRYDTEMLAWTAQNKELTDKGYGHVPDELLLPYAAYDAMATYKIMTKQIPLLRDQGYLNPRGDNGEYPSLMEAGLGCQRAIYEMQREGLGIDLERLDEITEAYNGKLQQLRTQLIAVAADYGMDDFNPGSPKQCIELLFEKVGLTPIQATNAFGGMDWNRVLEEPPEVQAQITPSTDKTTLDVLQDKSPVVKLLRDFRKIDHAVKTWLVPKSRYNPEEHHEESKGGGLRAKVWRDGRIHAVYSQLKETARLSSRNPNVQNFPKRAEGDIVRIFGEENKPADLRTVFVPRKGHYIIEADWTQAELFTLAAQSQDQNMLAALNTPGKDLHDLTAIDAFSLKMIDERENEITEDHLVAMATSEGVKVYENFVKTLSYVDQRGRIMDRGQFKNTIRVSAKNVNFGIPYGRTAAAIAVQVKGETGTDKSIDELAAELEIVVTTWKTKTYKAAWDYLMAAADSAVKLGYVENAWGRRRLFPKNADTNENAIRREAQNFPIQSTVADTCLIALMQLQQERDERGMPVKIINQVHDAVFFEAPFDWVEQTCEMAKRIMSEIKIPVAGHAPLQIPVDVEVMSRIGEKVK